MPPDRDDLGFYKLETGAWGLHPSLTTLKDRGIRDLTKERLARVPGVLGARIREAINAVECVWVEYGQDPGRVKEHWAHAIDRWGVAFHAEGNSREEAFTALGRKIAEKGV